MAGRDRMSARGLDCVDDPAPAKLDILAPGAAWKTVLASLGLQRRGVRRPLPVMTTPDELRAHLLAGQAIPALPLALDRHRRWNEGRQRAVARYYLDAGVGGKSGNSVSDAGDFNGDGVGDLIIGAWLASPGGDRFAGASYVVFGRAVAP